jgi:transketolase
VSLRFVCQDELRRIRTLDADPVARAAAFADACRLDVLYMVARAGSGHLGTSFSCLDVLSWLHLEVLGEGDRAFSSKGHDAPAVYAVLIGTDRLDESLLHRLRRLGGLPGHPDVATTPAVVTNTGSLGMGVSKAKGFLLADRLAGRGGDVYVITGDGELQEGQLWESLQGAANLGLGRLTAIVDHNKIQSDTWVDAVSDLGDIEAKARAFGWAVARCDGNDVGCVAHALAGLRERAGARPRMLIADTTKGAGVSFMEPRELPHDGVSLYGYHSGAPAPEEYERAAAEIEQRLNARLEALGAAPLRTTPADDTAGTSAASDGEGAGSQAPTGAAPQRLVAAYARELTAQADAVPELVALDADLVLDTGLTLFRERHPERFFECGIAEQDMVSQAGAMALAGLLPAVHSFACFLSTRPGEQIFNNASERTRVIYAGSLAGLVPGGPGHSHQSLRDVALMASVPGMTVIEPSTEAQCAAAVRWAVREASGPVYLRLTSVPWALPFDPALVGELAPGRGSVLRRGADVALVASGPVMASQAFSAAELLAGRGLQATVIELPWPRGIDAAWLAEAVGGAPVVTLDNHLVEGGLGAGVAEAIGAVAARLGVEGIPACGGNDEVLRAHALDAASVAERVAALPSLS